MMDGDLMKIAAAADRAGLGTFTVTPPDTPGVDFWRVEFHHGNREAVGYPEGGRSGFANLLVDIARLGAVYRATKLELPGLRRTFQRWREEDTKRR